MNKFTGLVRRCVEDYSMISPGDKICVGLSGGKDSVALLRSLAHLSTFYPLPYSLFAVTLDLGFGNVDFTPLRELCRVLKIPYTVVATDIKEIVFEKRLEQNPCSLCAKMRRGALIHAAAGFGCNKIALGHHYDDAVETFFLSLFYGGSISCFAPVTFLDRTGITQIRPLLYIGETKIQSLVGRYGLPVTKSLCPMDGFSKRQTVKELVKNLEKEFPDLKAKVFGAMQRLPLESWAPKEYSRRPLPND